MDKTILNRVSIVGCGRIGGRHASHIANYGQLSAVCDIIPEKAEELGKKYGVPSFNSIDDLLSFGEFDIVAICTPNGLHAQHSIRALSSGFHVICEKPLGISVPECAEMLKCAEVNNKRLFAIKQNRFNPPVAAVKELIDNHKLGKIFSVQLSCFWNRNNDYYANSWKGTKDLDGGTLYTQFSHFVDLLYWMIGDVKEAKSYTENFNHSEIIEFEDTGVVILKFFNGAIGTINYTVNSYAKNMEGSLTIFGEKGTVKIGGQYLNELEYQSVEGLEPLTLPEGNKPNNYGNYVGSMSNHDMVYQNLFEVLNNNAPISANSFEALKTVEIIDKIYSSAEE